VPNITQLVYSTARAPYLYRFLRDYYYPALWSVVAIHPVRDPHDAAQSLYMRRRFQQRGAYGVLSISRPAILCSRKMMMLAAGHCLFFFTARREKKGLVRDKEEGKKMAHDVVAVYSG
jgi:hypothetical protein